MANNWDRLNAYKGPNSVPNPPIQRVTSPGSSTLTASENEDEIDEESLAETLPYGESDVPLHSEISGERESSKDPIEQEKQRKSTRRHVYRLVILLLTLVNKEKNKYGKIEI